MTLKTNNFSFFSFFPYNSENKSERQKWISDSDSTSKKTSILKKSLIFNMTLKDNNTIKSIKCIILPEFGISQ